MNEGLNMTTVLEPEPTITDNLAASRVLTKRSFKAVISASLPAHAACPSKTCRKALRAAEMAAWEDPARLAAAWQALGAKIR